MKYRTLGSTGIDVSVIGIGTWQFGGEWGQQFTQDQVDRLFNAGREVGINLIDTAECYGDHLSEQLVGKAVEQDRQDWVLATKFGHKFTGPFERSEPRSPADVRTQLEDSLKALRTDYIDLYQYHSWGDSQFFDEDVLAELHRAKEAGKVRHLGNSVGKNDNVKQVEASQRMDLEAIQVVYNRLDRAPEETTLPVCIEQHLGVLARVPLASGYLSGKYQPGQRFDQSDVRGRRNAEKEDEKLTQVQQIKRDEVPDDTPMARWALAWCLQHPAMTCVIPGCKSADHVKDNAAAADLDALVHADHPQAVERGAGV